MQRTLHNQIDAFRQRIRGLIECASLEDRWAAETGAELGQDLETEAHASRSSFRSTKCTDDHGSGNGSDADSQEALLQALLQALPTASAKLVGGAQFKRAMDDFQ